MPEDPHSAAQENMQIPLFTIFLVFLKVGAFTFGGGYAILPVIQREMITHRKWVERDDFLNMLIITQSVPGALALNSAIQIGMRLRGIAGGLTAALGIVTPSVLIILIIASFFLPVFQGNIYVEAIFYGLRPAVVALIAAAAFHLGREILRDIGGILLAVALLLVSLLLPIHPIAILVAGGLAGMILFRKKGEL